MAKQMRLTRSKGDVYTIQINDSEYCTNIMYFHDVSITHKGQDIVAKTRWTATIDDQPACFDVSRGLYEKVFQGQATNNFQICMESLVDIDPSAKVILTVWIYDSDGEQRLENLSFKITPQKLSSTTIQINQLPLKKRKHGEMEEDNNSTSVQLLTLLKEQQKCEHDIYIAKKIINTKSMHLAEITAKIRLICDE